jgi:hypothetical protein
MCELGIPKAWLKNFKICGSSAPSFQKDFGVCGGASLLFFAKVPQDLRIWRLLIAKKTRNL